jgi:hypothetical protein
MARHSGVGNLNCDSVADTQSAMEGVRDGLVKRACEGLAPYFIGRRIWYHSAEYGEEIELDW